MLGWSDPNINAFLINRLEELVLFCIAILYEKRKRGAKLNDFDNLTVDLTTFLMSDCFPDIILDILLLYIQSIIAISTSASGKYLYIIKTNPILFLSKNKTKITPFCRHYLVILFLMFAYYLFSSFIIFYGIFWFCSLFVKWMVLD